VVIAIFWCLYKNAWFKHVKEPKPLHLCITTMKKLFIFAFALLAFSRVSAQDPELTHTMAYSTVKINVTDATFLRRYIAPGKEPVCGIYTAYNRSLYTSNGPTVKVENTDYIYPALGTCVKEVFFNDGPRPYAMFEVRGEVTKVDYETNTLEVKCDGATIVIETFNKEIDAWYKRFGKTQNLDNPHVHLILRNWNYTPESEDSYATNTVKYRKKVKFKTKRAKNQESYIHDSEYMK
jgi:hypothetical protein